MGWRFRKSFSPIKGVRLTFSPSGMSASVGSGPLRVTMGPRGTGLSTRIPGSGLSFHQRLNPTSPTEDGAGNLPEAPSPVDDSGQTLRPIASASTESLTSDGLESLRDALKESQKARAIIAPALRGLMPKERALRHKVDAWRAGWLLRRLLPGRLNKMVASLEEMQAEIAELQEQERLARVATQFSMPEVAREAYGLLRDAFAAVAQSIAIWDTVGERDTDQLRERSTATNTVERTRVKFAFGSSGLVGAEQEVPRLGNANGGDIYLYPGFVLVEISEHAFAVLSVADVNIEINQQRFIEAGEVPSDASVVGATWKRANKDGSRDRRFADNYEIPIALYGQIDLTSATGLRERFLISNTEAALRFVATWGVFQGHLGSHAMTETLEPSTPET